MISISSKYLGDNFAYPQEH